MRSFRWTALFILVAALTACGGGGGGSSSGVSVPRWGNAELIETNGGDAGNPRVAMDDSGNAVAVWHLVTGIDSNIRSNRYTKGYGWASAEVIESWYGASGNPQLAMDHFGNVVTVWSEYKGTGYSIGSSFYSVDTGWGVDEPISNDPDFVSSQQVATNRDGNVVAVWVQEGSGTSDKLWFNRHTLQSGWGLGVPIVSPIDGVSSPQVAIDENNNIVVVWVQFNDPYLSVWANRFTAISGWGPPVPLANNVGIAGNPRLALDSKGNAVVVWQQKEGSDGIWSSRYTVGTDSWGEAKQLDGSTDNAFDPQVATDGAGNSIVVWYQSDGTFTNIWSSRYTVETGEWSAAETIESYAAAAIDPKIAMNSNGNAVVVWQQDDDIGYRKIAASRFNIAEGNWSTPELISNKGYYHAYSPHVAIDINGSAVAVWSQRGASAYDIWSNRFN